MKVIIFRFEKEKFNFMECEVNKKTLILGDRETISLNSSQSSGEKYSKILDELLQINNRYSPDIFIYQPAPHNMRGKVDEIRFANEAMLEFFSYQEEVDLLKLNKPDIRKKLTLSNEVFKKRIIEEEKKVMNDYKLAKSDKSLKELVYVSMMKSVL